MRHLRAPRARAAGVSHPPAPCKPALHHARCVGGRPVRVSLNADGHRLIRVATPITFQRYEEQLNEAVGKGLLLALFSCGLGLLLAAVLSWVN